MLSKFLMACGVYVAMGAVIGWTILLVMRPDDAKYWPLALVLIGYTVAVGKIGCTDH